MLRRRLRGVLPALSYHFGIKWTDIESMPAGEVNAYIDALDDIAQAMKR